MASVSYRINGQADLSPIQKAKKEMTSLDKQSAKFKNTLKTLKVTAAVAAIKQLTTELLECEKAFAEAEKATARIDFATQLNPTLNKTSKQLADFATKTSKALRGAVSVDEINEQIAKLSFDKTGEQIEKIIDVATDLSAAMGTTLDQAVNQLNGTLSGEAGELAKVFPELKNLTKESLQAGEAIDVISGKVKGMGEALSQTTSGSLSAYQNAMDNLKETLGRATTNFFTPIRDKITEIITSWVDAKNALLDYKLAQEHIDSGNGTLDDYRVIYEDAMKDLEAWESNFVVVGKDENGSPLYVNKERKDSYINADLISRADYMNARKDYADKVYKAGQDYSYAKLTAEAAKRTAEAAEAAAKATESVVNDSSSTSGSSVASVIEDTTSEEIETIKSFYAHTIDDFEYQKTILTHIDTTFEDAMQNAVKNGLGDVGTLIEDIETGSLSLLVDFVGELMGAISSQSEAINNVLNFVSYFVNGIAKPIADTLNYVLSPLVPILDQLINIVRRVVELVAPIAQYVIGPIAKVITTIATSILVPIYNVVVAIHNALHWRDKWQYLNLGSEIGNIWSSSSSPSTTTPTSGATSSGSYTAARDIYLNVTFSHSFCNGDGKEVAIMIRDEIQRAERLGY